MPREGHDSPERTGNFKPRAQLALSRPDADRFHHNFVGTEHLLLGLVAVRRMRYLFLNPGPLLPNSALRPNRKLGILAD